MNEGGITGKKLSRKTIKHIHATLKQALGYAVDIGKISKNPLEKYKIKKQEDEMNKVYCFTKEEEIKLIQELNLKNSMDIAILTAIETGLRQGEIAALTWGDINLEKKEISVTKSLSIMKNRDSGEDNNYKKVIKPPKTKSSIRTVPISSALSSDLKAFKDYLDENNFPTGKNDIAFHPHLAIISILPICPID